MGSRKNNLRLLWQQNSPPGSLQFFRARNPRADLSWGNFLLHLEDRRDVEYGPVPRVFPGGAIHDASGRARFPAANRDASSNSNGCVASYLRFLPLLPNNDREFTLLGKAAQGNELPLKSSQVISFPGLGSTCFQSSPKGFPIPFPLPLSLLRRLLHFSPYVASSSSPKP